MHIQSMSPLWASAGGQNTYCPCNQADTTIKWNVAITTLTEWMKQEQSDPQLNQILTMGLQTWQDNAPQLTNSPVAHQQSELGWDATLDGWLRLEW